jgi:hypothetical protein
MSRAQKVALLLIWLGIVGGIAAVLFSWQVRREWVEPGGYMLVRHNLLTAEVDVWIGGEWVPLPRAGRRRGPLLAESRRQQAEAPSGVDSAQPALPARAPSPGVVEPPHQPQRVAAPAPRRARTPAPVRVRARPAAPPAPPPEAAAPASQAALPPAEEEVAPAAVSTDPDIPIVRAPSSDQLPEAGASPSPPSDQVASAGEDAPAASTHGPA